MSKYKLSENYYTRCIETENSNGLDVALLYNNRGHTKYMQVEFDAAVEDYNSALRMNPQLAIAYYNRGTIHYRLGNCEDAVSDMERAVALEPTNAEFCEGLEACVHLQKQRTQK